MYKHFQSDIEKRQIYIEKQPIEINKSSLINIENIEMKLRLTN